MEYRRSTHIDSVSQFKVIQLDGTKYAAGMILPAGQCSGLPEFQKIETILIDAEKVAFVCQRLSSSYIEDFRSYELVEHTYADFLFLDPDVLTDYHP